MRETNNLEFKESFTKTFLKTVSAFANYGTGRILFGVSDGGDPIGLADPVAMVLQIENTINDTIDPVPRYSIDVNAADDTVCLTVFEGEAKPYLYAKKAYRRADSATVEVDRIEFGRLVLAGQNLTFDGALSSQEDLSFSLLSQRFMEHLGLTGFDDNALKTLGLKRADGCYTNAAEIFADRNGLAGVDIVKFGESINELQERRTVAGQSVLSQYDAALEMYERYCVYEEVALAARKRVEKVPFEAYREAVANALVHRTWDVDANVTISIHDDSIVMVSPGGLPSGVSEAEYLGGGISIPRNPIVANIFFRLGYIEQLGTGIARINEAYSGLPVKPRFEIRANSISVTLPFLSNKQAGLTLDEASILDNMSQTLLLSRGELEKRTGLTKDKTTRLLNGLVSRGLVVREGVGRATKYRRV